jgi:hypothetical protein
MDVKLPFFSFIAFNFRFKDFHHTFDKLNKKNVLCLFYFSKNYNTEFFLIFSFLYKYIGKNIFF